MDLAKLKTYFLQAVFPQHCLNCQKPGGIFCYDCLSLIEINNAVFCAFCSHPHQLTQPGNCPKHQNKNLNGVFSAASFHQPLLKKLIHNFKYPPYLKNLSASLAFLIISHFALLKHQPFSQAGENSILMPVPLRKTKQKQRGFNQAELIAEELSLYFKIPLTVDNLIKIKNTLSQTTLNKQERQENIKGGFAVKNPGAVQAKTIFLIDDVMTTGATLEECASALKRAGAKRIWGITAARD